MNLDYDDARITCSNCGTKYFPEVGMSPCPNCSGRMGGYTHNYKEDNMGWYAPEPECTADVGVMGHLGCNNPNCSCKAPDEPVRDYQGNVESPSYKPIYSSYTPPDEALKHKGLIHQTEKAKLFAIKHNKAIYEIWIPNSCIRGLTEKKVIVSRSFYTQSVLKQLREQGAIV